MKEYRQYELEDLVLDKEFRTWVFSPEAVPNSPWTKLGESDPAKGKLIKKAARLVRALEPIEEQVPEQSLSDLWKRISKSRQQKASRAIHWAFKYAAVFILAFSLGIGGVYLLKRPQFTDTYTEITVPYGERSQVTLYDGTKVWMNSGTKLKFPIVFNQNQRKVFVEGEAFFDVAKNKKNPFIVHANQMEIKVLGTRFNVCAYPDEDQLYATLEEGKIEAKTAFAKNSIQLKPGEQLALNLQTKTITLDRVETELYTSWKENLLRFQEAPFSEVITKMERWYDVDIEIGQGVDVNRKYNMSIKTESLREMLRLISLTTPIAYEINEGKVLIHRP